MVVLMLPGVGATGLYGRQERQPPSEELFPIPGLAEFEDTHLFPSFFHQAGYAQQTPYHFLGVLSYI